MADIVLIHGIDQQQRTADALESEWLPELAGGIRLAGLPDVADRIWRGARTVAGIDARMAFYGNLFLVPGIQGSGAEDFTEEEAEFAESLAREWLNNVAERATRQEIRLTGMRERAFVQTDLGVEQGARSFIRTAISSLAKIEWFAPYGMGFAERFVYRALSQVTRYFTNNEIRDAALRTALSLIGPETKVIIAHSLGSVIAFEVAHRLRDPLLLLLTLGSPLGLQTIIYQKLRPQPPSFPPLVRRWVNVADRNDFIAADPNLRALFGVNIPGQSVLEDTFTVDNGAEPHRVEFYLTKVQVGNEVGTLFRRNSP